MISNKVKEKLNELKHLNPYVTETNRIGEHPRVISELQRALAAGWHSDPLEKYVPWSNLKFYSDFLYAEVSITLLTKLLDEIIDNNQAILNRIRKA